MVWFVVFVMVIVFIVGEAVIPGTPFGFKGDPPFQKDLVQCGVAAFAALGDLSRSAGSGLPAASHGCHPGGCHSGNEHEMRGTRSGFEPAAK